MNILAPSPPLPITILWAPGATHPIKLPEMTIDKISAPQQVSNRDRCRLHLPLFVARKSQLQDTISAPP